MRWARRPAAEPLRIKELLSLLAACMPSSTSSPPLPLSDRLALQRTRLANERTLFTYVRTSLALVGFGLALLQFHPERGGRLGYTALAVAVVVLGIGLLRFRTHRRRLAAYEQNATEAASA